jgi:hypothetical protein
MDAFLELRSALSAGRVRAAEPDPESPLGWRVNAWVKQGILLGFRLGTLVPMGGDEFSFVDKSTYPRGDSGWRKECAWCRAARPSARAPSWLAAWCACRRCM